MINEKDVFDMKSSVGILACVLWAALLSSCVPVTPRPVVPNRVETHPGQVLALHAQWGEEDPA